MFATLRALLFPSAPGAFRLWLALVVVFHHLTRLEIGKTPVLVFFALSGYWVYRVWNERYAATRTPCLTFAVSRWWRLAPVMLLAVAICALVMPMVSEPTWPVARDMPVRQVLSSTFFLGYAQMPARPLGPAWSLDVEMQFYLVAPLLIFAMQRLSAIFALGAAYIVYSLGLAFYPEVALPIFIIPFVLGMVAAREKWTVSPRIAHAGHVLAVLLVAMAALSPLRPLLLGDGPGSEWPTFNIAIAALLLPQALVSVQSEGGKFDKVWADQSYIVYLLHWPAILILRGPEWPTGVEGMIYGLALAAFVAGLSAAVYRWIDRPLNRARSRWVASRRKNVVASAESATKEGDIPPVFA
ncbi:MAG: acyltransferase family protein [Novosphingobium sp.]